MSVPRESNPDFDIEYRGIVECPDQQRFDCVVKIRLPKDSYDPYEVSVFAAPPRLQSDGMVRITPSQTGYTNTPFEFILERVHIRSILIDPTSMRSMNLPSVDIGFIGRLRILHQIRAQQEQSTSRSLTVLLSESNFLRPNVAMIPRADGGVEIEEIDCLTLKVPDLGTVKFQREYRRHNPKGLGYACASELICRVEWTSDEDITDDKASILRDQIDNLCLGASIAQRSRVRARGYEGHIDGLNQRVLENPCASIQSYDQSPLEALIPFAARVEFMARWQRFLSRLSDTNLLRARHACAALAPLSPMTAETKFVGLFASLEGLLSIDRDDLKLHFAVSEDSTWKLLKAAMKSAINSFETQDETFKRKSVLRNLEALRRVPLSEAVEYIFKRRGLQNELLWPIYGARESLSNIRNKLLHGDRIESQVFESFCVASQHLELHVERLILSLVGWNIYQSDVSDHVVQQLLFCKPNYVQERREVMKSVFAGD